MDDGAEPTNQGLLGPHPPANTNGLVGLDGSPGVAARCRELSDALHERDTVISEIAHLRRPSADLVARLDRADERVDALINAVTITDARSFAELSLKLRVYRLAQEILGREDQRAERIAETVLRELELLLSREAGVAMGSSESRNGTGSGLPIWKLLGRPDALLGRAGSRRSQA